MIVTEAPRHNATKTRQEVATNPKRVGQDMMTPKTPVLRESGELRTTSKNQDAAKPYSPVQLAQKREEPLVKSDLKASSSAIQSRGDTTPVKRVTSKIAGTLKDLRNESMRHGSNQVPPANEQVQPQPVFFSKSRFAALEPNVQVTPANERPQVVQQIWANDIVKAGVKPMRGEQTIRAQVPQSLYKPQVQSKPLINVDSAYVRPTLEASALKQPTLADAKLNAAANPRVILEPERFQKPLIEKQIQAEPLHKATAVARESRSPERSISTTAPRNHQRAENSEPSNFFNKVEFGTNDFVIAKMGHAPVVTDPARHLKPHSVVDKAAIQRQATSETTFKRDNTIESKSQNVTSPNSGPNIQSVKPELKIEQLSARVPFATLPEFELPKQSALSSSVNEPVDESIQSETSPAPLIRDRPRPSTLSLSLKQDQRFQVSLGKRAKSLDKTLRLRLRQRSMVLRLRKRLLLPLSLSSP
ncbi:MAG: hypothetical protein IPP40_06805 [bacterium]|nr:hypothetical protein [bacterium]